MVVTIRHLRPHGVTQLLVYCTDIVCNHGATMPIAQLADDLAIKSLEPRMRCRWCGRKGADVRPDYPSAPNAFPGNFGA